MYRVSLLQEPTDDQILQIVDLYKDQGWWEEGVEGPDLVARIVKGSHCFAIAQLEGKIIGIGRAISDRASDAYIQDVLVDKAFRGSGVGSKVVGFIIQAVHADGLRWIGVIAEPGSAPFYEPLGFQPISGATPMLKRK